MEGIKTKLELMIELYNDHLAHLIMMQVNEEYLRGKIIQHPNLVDEQRALEHKIKEQEQIVLFVMDKILEMEKDPAPI